ncbi:MAG: hypothetical protein ACM3YE_12890 [Bacteroidota bacterium]
MFGIITVAIVLGIIVLFGFGAFKAEKVIDAKAKAARESQTTKVSSKTGKAPKEKGSKKS